MQGRTRGWGQLYRVQSREKSLATRSQQPDFTFLCDGLRPTFLTWTMDLLKVMGREQATACLG